MDETHWVEELFRPTFHLRGEEIDKPVTLDQASPVLKQGRRIREIFECVKQDFDENLWNARQKSTQVSDSLLEDCAEDGDSTAIEENERQVAGDDELDSADILEEQHSNNSQLWDSEEMEVLRGIFMRTKLENENLKVELEFVKDEIENVTRKLKEKEKHWKAKNERAKSVKRAFEKLLLENKHLKEEVRVMEQRYSSVDEEFKDLTVKTNHLKKEKAMERKQFLREQSKRREVEYALKKLEMEQKTGENAALETVKLSYESEILHLSDRMNEVGVLLEKEREEHKQTRRALDHMRYHFSSLPLKHVDTRPPDTADGDILENLRIF